MKITVDTNILIAATFWTGASYKIIEKVENKEVILIISQEIILEYYNVLQYEEIQNKIRNKNLETRLSVEKIIELSKIVIPTKRFKAVKRDPDDDKIIEAAVAGNADYIISNDNHLLELKEFEGIKIIKPEEFLRLL